MNRKEILKQTPLFSCLDDIELEKLAEIAWTEAYPKDRVPIKEGDRSSSLYIMLSGRTNAITYNHRKEKIIHNTFLPGDYFGEMSFIDGEPRCASVETAEYTEVLVLPRKSFQQVFAHNPSIAEAILKGLLYKLRRATNEVHQLMQVIAQKELHDAHLEMIESLVRAAEFKDRCTAGHIIRISRYSALIGEKIGLPPEKIRIIQDAAPMHDVGKIGIPESILNKPGKLTKKEFEIIKTHTTIGGRILANPRSDLLTCAKTIALCHHEKFDGSGYPMGIRGEEIPLEARIISVVDAFDAITSERPYQEALSVEEAMRRIKKDRSIHFDPEITDALVKNQKELTLIKESLEPYRSDYTDEEGE